MLSGFWHLNNKDLMSVLVLGQSIFKDVGRVSIYICISIVLYYNKEKTKVDEKDMYTLKL